MAFNDIERQRAKNEVGAFVESIRPPEPIRKELDISYSIWGQSVEIEECRPVWRGDPGEVLKLAVAKIVFIREHKAWRLYWMRSSIKWEMLVQVETLREAIDIIRDDQSGFFFG
ncbi:DUF3024 domain-containing protein [Rouxiella badensis]|uniref:DUF3024 domain-containing protein n=1 Tax=Rouxiella badensis TaxID=1646377 RepID=UPI0013EF14D3|nr:DUF3024 domain-containing protein [Rouxiella badensis]QII37860.1 DUF3024 domain-containing protein [Rouxiella badensis]